MIRDFLRVTSVLFALVVMCCSAASIPIIDVSPLFSSDVTDYLRCAHEIDSAFRTYGLFLASNHNIDKSLRHDMMESGRSLFRLDDEDKRAVQVTSGGFMRGYISFGAESGLASVFEPKEGYSYGYSWMDGDAAFSNSLQGHNVWPSSFDSSHFDSLFTKDVSLAEAIVRGISSVIHGDATSLNHLLQDGDTISIMRLFHYFTTPSSDNIMGSSPHTDWGFITIISQDDVGGLQFFDDGTWIDVPARPELLVVNAGDFLQIISGGRYKSPVHRVLAPSERDRLSFVFFYYPNYDIPLNADLFQSQDVTKDSQELEFNTFLSGDAVAIDIDKEMTFGDYISQKWKGVYRNKENY